MSLFPADTADAISRQVEARWDLDGPLPTPRGGWLSCPVCGGRRVHARYWRTHVRQFPGVEQHRISHRCDVAFKCTLCCATWTHGLPIDEQTFHRLRQHGEWIGWRQARQILQEA